MSEINFDDLDYGVKLNPVVDTEPKGKRPVLEIKNQLNVVSRRVAFNAVLANLVKTDAVDALGQQWPCDDNEMAYVIRANYNNIKPDFYTDPKASMNKEDAKKLWRSVCAKVGRKEPVFTDSNEEEE